jgi:hypothetical protein
MCCLEPDIKSGGMRQVSANGKRNGNQNSKMEIKEFCAKKTQ